VSKAVIGAIRAKVLTKVLETKHHDLPGLQTILKSKGNISQSETAAALEKAESNTKMV